MTLIACKLNIVSASLFVKKVSVSPGVRLGHAQALLSTTAKYPIERVCLNNFSIPPGSRVSNQENLFLGTLPKSIILAMTENAGFLGAYDKNPFAFKHFNLEFLALYRDGIQIPSKPFQPEYENGSAVRDFYQLVLSTGRHLKNHALAIDRKDFLNGYTRYGFNLSPDEDCSNHIYIYIYAFSRRFYPKRLSAFRIYMFFVCVFPGNRTHNLCAANAML